MIRARWRFSVVAGCALTFALAASHSLGAQGTITGRITSDGNTPVADARVIVLGGQASATTGEDGKYTLRNVQAGRADVQALKVGYRALKKSVEVASGSSVVVDFTMAQAVVQLQEIVTTATGEQRKIELGNAISTLGDVGKRVEQSEITSMSDLLVAKAPGVQVLGSPVVGGAPTIRVRGLSSLSLSNAPIWIVDGVRYNTNNTSSSGANSLSLLNNLSPEEIEDIEIVKGPSAATLYGTAAANGVIVVTTKKGRAGAPKWTFSAESRTVDDRNPYQTQYASFGHKFGSTAPIRCQLYVMQTPAFSQAQGATCIQDSLTSYNNLTDPSQTIIQLGRGSLYGANVSGGNDAVRFYVSSDLDHEYGPIGMPQSDIHWYTDTLHVSVSDQMRHPRQQNKFNVRSNLSTSITPKLDLTATAGFGKSDNIIEVDNSAIIGLLYVQQSGFGWKGCPKGTETTGCGMTGADGKNYYDPTGFPLHDANSFAPGSIMQYTTTDDVQRFTGSLNANWRPLAWMQNDATVGVDLANNDQFHVCRLNECPNSGATARVGNVSDTKRNARNFSAKINSTGTWQPRGWANFKTSVGADYTNVEGDTLSASSRFLAPGASALGAGSTAVSWSATTFSAVKTLGYYVQEQFAFRDRLFLTAAVRQDQNSAFGTNFQNVKYPKLSVSWLASDESFFPHPAFLNSFRFRSAYGASGVQPGATAALQTFSATTSDITTKDLNTGTAQPGLIANNPGNAFLRPEKSTELETGFESDLFDHRLHIDFTHYNKKTHDALINIPIPFSVASPVSSLLQNVGSTQNWGNELQANLAIVQRRNFGWDVTLSASHNDNKWLDLGIDPGTGKSRIIGSGTATQERLGDPLFAQWYRNYSFNDANHDGIIQQSEVVVDTALTKHGVGFAKDLVSVQNGFDLFSHKLRVNAMFDYKGGGNGLDGNYFQCSSTPKACQETQDRTSSLALQARAVAQTYGTKVNGTTYTTRLGYFVNNQFWKFRELSAVVSLPERLTRLVNASSGSTIVLGARNLHTWSPFTGVDPEQNYGVSNEVQQDFNTSPPPTYFTFRLNLKY
jgi:TonB-linked SusC/RagA family outer membrane protein